MTRDDLELLLSMVDRVYIASFEDVMLPHALIQNKKKKKNINN
jgi:hypothetical protein